MNDETAINCQMLEGLLKNHEEEIVELARSNRIVPLSPVLIL